MSHKRNRQLGSLYVVVIFVLVVMGFLATTLTRIEFSNTDAHVKELLGTQAWMLAQSVNEEALTIVYPLNSTSSAIAANCSAAMPINTIVDGANRFHSVASCELLQASCEPVGTLADMNYFKLTAQVSCGSGKSLVERSEEIWVRESL
ncbi:MSHA biogenesis protein MshP [Vibrio intestinalis]|uniref:MSHA biogenesis protein MshP n=1 Tax=Vibrio intestinalis TaxID=2933291 RepID=UPI0021A77CBC|nr:MSHA biogenesis protein MshP [Vibrio intestinalis]